MELGDESKQAKLMRVLSIWEKNTYLSEDVIKKMQSPPESEAFMKEWREEQEKVCHFCLKQSWAYFNCMLTLEGFKQSSMFSVKNEYIPVCAPDQGRVLLSMLNTSIILQQRKRKSKFYFNLGSIRT